jgi:hypothetical protein
LLQSPIAPGGNGRKDQLFQRASKRLASGEILSINLAHS